MLVGVWLGNADQRRCMLAGVWLGNVAVYAGWCLAR